MGIESPTTCRIPMFILDPESEPQELEYYDDFEPPPPYMPLPDDLEVDPGIDSDEVEDEIPW